MKTILLINQAQFGYHSDTYYYCKYLCNSFDITYICWDYGHEKIELKGINVIYISRKGNIAIRNLRFIWKVLKELQNNYDFNLIKYFRGCSSLKILNPKKKFLFDIRTGSVNKKNLYRHVYDFFMKTEGKLFQHISVISKSLAQKLNIDKKAYILPLGADIISDTNKKFNSINLLYVGTLSNRNIEQTIKGFSKFYHEYNGRVEISYTIIGSGFENETHEIKKIVFEEKLTEAVKLTGQLPHDKLKPYFDKCNIGVSFIPQTDYFDVQPPTKTFEYFLSGMPVIATNTKENAIVVNKKNGILINDDSESFFEGLIKILNNKNQYNSEIIRRTSMQFTWHTIVADLRCHLEAINRA